jgi:lysophospholipase L1-like esterase
MVHRPTAFASFGGTELAPTERRRVAGHYRQAAGALGPGYGHSADELEALYERGLQLDAISPALADQAATTLDAVPGASPRARHVPAGADTLLVPQILVDQAYESGRWRHPLRHLHIRVELDASDVSRGQLVIKSRDSSGARAAGLRPASFRRVGSVASQWRVSRMSVRSGSVGTTSRSGGGSVTENWIAAWGTAQQLAPVFAAGEGPEMPDDGEHDPLAPTRIDDQTVRMVARTTVDGSAVRVALSNSFGYAPVCVGSAYLDDTRLTFGGRDTVVLPTGGYLTSDPVEGGVTAQTDVVISLYIPGSEVTPTAHQIGLRTAWLAPGDQAGEQKLDDATAFASYLWLTGIDVLAPPEAETIVAFGDSVVDGLGTSPDADALWPSQLARRLAAEPGLAPRAVVNMGIGGNRVLREADRLGASALARFDRDVLGRPGVRSVILFEGLNDMFFNLLPGMESDTTTADDIVVGYRMLIARARAHGVKLIGCTLLPIGSAPAFSAELEEMRQAVNRWIRSSGTFDAVVDLDAALRAPEAPDTLPAHLLAADQVHPNDAGHRAIAEVFDLDLFRG